MSEYPDKLEDKAAAFRRNLLSPTHSPGANLPTILSYEKKSALREAVENFRAYWEILREWDERDRFQESTEEKGELSNRLIDGSLPDEI